MTTNSMTVDSGTFPGPDSAAAVWTEVGRSFQRYAKGFEMISPPSEAMARTPRAVVARHGTMALYHYTPQTDEVYRVPLLLVHSLITRPTILDLVPGNSLVEHLVTRGFDVYLVDWGIPRPEDKCLRLEDYILEKLPLCVEAVQRESGEPDVSMLGYCLGGTMALMYAALHADGPLKNLICLTTPVNFEELGLFRRWSDPRFFDVDRAVQAAGNMPPELLLAAFESLRPAARLGGQIRLWDNLWDDDFVRWHRLLDTWALEQIPFPGECFRQVVKDLSWGNKLRSRDMVLGGRQIDLADVTVPVLHAMAEHDHVVPRESALELVDLVGSEDRQSLVLKGGHASVVAGPRAPQRLWPQMEEWLAPRST